MSIIDKHRALIEDGFCIIENLVPNDFLERLRTETTALADGRAEIDRVEQRSTGSLINVLEMDSCPELLTFQPALDAMAAMGYDDPRFTSGYIISKPPKSPRLFWHHDWACWTDPGAFDPVPQQLFLMYYLVDTTPENGCLRVIPRSHLEDNPLHDLLSEAHTPELREARNLDSIEYALRPDEVDVCVKAGDLVIGDSRILHASHANDSDARRTVITLWFHPDMKALHEGTQGFIASMTGEMPKHWNDADRTRVEPLLARYDGDVEPFKWNRERVRP